MMNMDAEGSSFSFSSTADYSKGQDTTDISWADIFLDGIHSDDPNNSEPGNIGADTSGLGAGMHGNTQQMHHQAQSNIMGGQLQIHIPTQLQGSIGNNAVQQGGAKLCGTVTYLAPSGTAQQHVNAGHIQNMMAMGGHHQVTTSLGQQQQQNSAKLVQIAPSYPVTSLGNTLPLQTLIQSGQTLTGQTLYGGQGAGLFPAQGSVHIENPKVVNVNFGPHVIGSDGGGQQAIFQTAEGKRVLITNSQLQHMSQSISLTQPIMGTQLINTGGGNVIRASLAPGTHTIMPSGGTTSRQIVLPSGHTMIPQQGNTGAGGMAKNVVLRQLNPNMSSIIYQSGQGGQLIHSQPTLISSGSGLQVVNTGGSQGNQVQLIAQPSLNQGGIGQQQGTVMNLINNSGNGNQITGLMPGQNIFVNGQVLSIGQLGSLGVPQLQVQQNSQGGMTLADINAQFQSSAPHLVIQQGGQQQQIVLQPKNNPSPSFMTNAVLSHRFISGLPGNKTARTPTPNASSASSTPVMTPTPSTPTPTPTPELMADFTGGKSSQSIDIFKQALDMSDIDLQSFEDDISFLDDTAGCFSSITPQPAPQTPAPPVKPLIKPAKSKSKASKSRSKNVQPVVNVTLHNSILSMQQNPQEQNVTLNPQQRIVTANGQVYVLSGNNFVLQQQPASSASQMTSHITPMSSIASTATATNRTQMTVSPGYHIDSKGQIQQGSNQATFHSLSLPRQIKVEPNTVPVSLGQNSVFSFSESDRKTFFKASPGGCGDFTVTSSASAARYNTYTTVSFISSQPTISPSSADSNQMQSLQLKNQKISTLGGTFIKQTPISSVIKQENLTDFNQPVSSIQSFTQPVSSIQSFAQPVSSIQSFAQPVSSIQSFAQSVSNIQTFNQAGSGVQSFNQSSLSHIQSLPHMAASATTPTTSYHSPTSSFSGVSSPVVISSALVTTTTQSHQTTIMSTSHLATNQQGLVSTTNSYQPHLSVFSDASCLPLNADSHPQNLSPGLLHNTASALPPNLTGRSSSKERDPAYVKTMIPIRIADCTLMLSLTPGEKERLESKLSQMSKKDQEEFLMHQQGLIRRSQQMQVEQQLKQQQQKQMLQLKHPQQQDFQQQEPSQPQKQALQMTQYLPDQQQPQLSRADNYSPVARLAQPTQGNDLSELMSPPAGQMSQGLPTTVQELMEKPEVEQQISFQPFSSQMPADQSQQQLHHTPSPQQQQQQQMYSNLQQRAASLPQTCGPVQPFGVAQIGRCLAEQQLLRDRSLAMEPDVSTPFKSFSDAMRRLVRYHTLQDHKPDDGSKAHKIWDARYSKLCDYLVRKKRCYMRRYHKMMLYRDLCLDKQPDYIQNLLCFNEQLRAGIDSDKEEAISNPDLFDPTKPGYRRNGPATSLETSTDDVSCLRRIATESNVMDFKHRHLTLKRNRSPVSEYGSELGGYPQSSSLKRAATEKGLTGMLKLVIKRRTLDNFIVKNSVEDVKALPRDLRPVVDVEKSDSEYEFDTSAADVSKNQPVIVRRRTLSFTSHQTSFDAGSESDSASSHMEETAGQLSEEEEDLEEDGEESDEDEDFEEKSSGDNDEFVDRNRKMKHEYHISFGEDIDSNDVECDSDDSCDEDADALMETDTRVSEQASPYFEVSKTGTSSGSFSSTGQNTDIQNYHSKDSLSPNVSCDPSATSDPAFNPSLPYSNLVQNRTNCNDHKNGGSVRGSVEHRKFSFGASAGDATRRFCPSSHVSLPVEEEEEEEEYVADSPVSSLEKEAARTGLPSSTLFTTPNKNLLATDAMFNSDEEDDVRGSARLVSKFEIDNKDPQSSMIDESVRSVIDSVLNDNGDDDNHKGPQTNWAPSTHKLPPSTGHRNLFHHFSSSVLLPSGHDPNRDVTVPNNLKS